MNPIVRIVGPGRAGRSFALALRAIGWDVPDPVGRGEPTADLAAQADLVLVCTPDAEVAAVAAAIAPGRAALAHVAGSLGTDVLGSHRRRAAVHPLMALPDPETGARRLLGAGWFAVAGDPIAGELVAALGGRAFRVADEHRALYHAAACVASNHVVALLGQVERLAAGIGVPAEAYVDLARASVDNVGALGAAAALTGPAARGDAGTIERHLDAMPPGERALYRALVEEARRLAGRAERFDDR
jgi:predicted short-subunit dehydrogenase-like oxidoreductase (DUF2520 family)